TFGVTCNCISPGYVWTPLVEKQIPDTMKARNMTAEQVKRDVLLAAQPTKQFVTVEQVASLALYLCSDAAAQITGSNLTIAGGWPGARRTRRSTEAAGGFLARDELRRRPAASAARRGRAAVLVPADGGHPDPGLVRRAVELLFALRRQPAQYQSTEGPDHAL